MTFARSHEVLRHLTALLSLFALLLASGSAFAQNRNEPKTLSKAEIEQLVAPIALHPDALVSQVLMASTYPLEVVEAQRWVKANPGVTGDALEGAMEKQPWDPSVKSLTAFPQVLDMMNAELSWTQQLGDAFLAQQDDVLAAVQTLRAKADAAGNLATTKQQTVEKQTVTDTAGARESVIVIETAEPDVVYVPAYDPAVVYGEWAYPSYPPYYWYPPGYVAGNIFWFGAGVAAGYALWGHCDWGRYDVDINVKRYNEFNRTNITNKEWTHNSVHRKGVPYRDRNVAERYGKGHGDARAKAREQFRGRADSGRRDLASVKPDSIKKPDRGGKKPNRAGKTPDRKKPAAKKPGAKKPAAKKPAARKTAAKKHTSASRHAKSKTAFHGAGSGRQVKQHSARGKSSRHAMRPHGGPRGGGHGRRGGGRRR